jgi:NADH-quinone oxidoreductase subunit G
VHRLGTELGLEGFSQVDLPALQDEMKAAIFAANDGAGDAQQPVAPVAAGDGLYRVGEVPMYSADALCRRAAALQQTAHASNDFVGLNPADAARIGLAEGSTAGVRPGEALVKLPVRVSARVPVGAAWLRSATGVACQLGAATGPIQVEVA